MKPEEAVQGLGALAAGLCRDADIGVELTENSWAFDPVRRVILMSRDSMRRRGMDYCAGIVAHEVGHFFVSRYMLFDGHFPSVLCLSSLLNAIEDPRCETWMMQRYPGVVAWLELVGQDFKNRQYASGMPRFLVFALECARERDRDWQPPPEQLGVPAEIAQALDRTREARYRYTQILPPLAFGAGSQSNEDLRRYQDEVPLRLKPGQRNQAQDEWERIVRLSALDAYKLAESDILPQAAMLLEADVADVASALAADRALESQAKAALEGGNPPPVTILRLALARGAEVHQPAKPSLRELAMRLIEAVVSFEPPKGLGDALGRHGASRSRTPFRSAGPPPPTQVPRLPPPESQYDRVLQNLNLQVDQLVQQLRDMLVPRQRLRELAGYPSGFRVDLRQLMQFEADPRRYRKLWHRKTLPERKDASFSLLVDLSGSMSGPKASAALAGTILLCETLSRLGVPFAVNGFQDRLIPFCSFDEGLSVEVRNRLPGMVLETEGSRPGGHNQYNGNDDGPCLMEAAMALAGRACTTKMLVVISDGEPAGSRSTPQDLHAAVAAIQRRGDVQLVAIGLGPDTGHVRHYYPRSVANVPPTELAGQIGRVIEEALVR